MKNLSPKSKDRIKNPMSPLNCTIPAHLLWFYNSSQMAFTAFVLNIGHRNQVVCFMKYGIAGGAFRFLSGAVEDASNSFPVFSLRCIIGACLHIVESIHLWKITLISFISEIKNFKVGKQIDFHVIFLVHLS